MVASCEKDGGGCVRTRYGVRSVIAQVPCAWLRVAVVKIRACRARAMRARWNANVRKHFMNGPRKRPEVPTLKN